MARLLSAFELEILRKLAHGEPVLVPPRLRLGLEMAGVIREGAQGIAITDHGRRLANRKASQANLDTVPTDKVAFDRRGRRMPLKRRSVF
ncbi:hypothetical protein [Reyranella soli]|jgi:hypothetical protein|uniref:Uncharacterized protein n=1 Tax=Reyranella soli TaxID=1230389 RepID=A0A512NMQ0_9HYPH|nr:hypothetical protein [Reyranella soli]GEP60226.1 hypothetical protein RSO01_73920 [Reyranella soli]